MQLRIRYALLPLCLSCFGLATVASAQSSDDVIGDWRGVLKVQGTELPLIFHIHQSDTGLSATLVSPAQSAAETPLDSVVFEAGRIEMKIAAIGGSYSGTLGDDGTIAGEWSQGGMSLPLDLARDTGESKDASEPGSDVSIAGDWLGTLATGAVELRLVLHLEAVGETRLKGTLDSPDQGASGIAASRVVFREGHLEVTIPAVAGSYEATLADGGRLEGTWKQGGVELPLVLERIDEPIVLNRPQVPSEPYPYEEEEIRVTTPDPEVTLAGTLTRPAGDEPVTTVLLITGSGPQDRDESLMGHQPFLILADHLTRLGLAVLRLDDRGFGESTGNFATATSADFADDAAAAVAYLSQRSDVGNIGLIGHSEGGLIAPIVANRSADVDFVVLMAGPGLTGAEIIYLQSRLIILAGGGTEEEAEKTRKAQEALFAAMREEDDTTKLKERLRRILSERAADSDADETSALAAIDTQVAQFASPWYRYFVAYDPIPALRKLECPVLAIIGEKDLQVPPEENLEAIRTALEAGENPDFDLLELEGLNHLFQTAETGAPNLH